jgi:hypothetical protein
MEARGVVSMELTIGSKFLATAFFVVEVQGNYSVILGCNWIHTNRCIPSTLHEFLIQWFDNQVEVVHTDALAYISRRNGRLAAWKWHHTCLSGNDLTGYNFLSISKDGFVPMSM